jgi:hypothetical protein
MAMSETWEAERLESATSFEEAPTAPLITRADIDQLDEALEIASRALRARHQKTDRVYAVYHRSLADLIAGRRTAAAGSFSVLQAAQADIA